MDALEVDRADIVISTLTLAEFLRGSTPAQRAKQNAIIEETFIVWPFDTRAAHILADKFDAALTVDDYQARRAVLKVDLLIVATAAAAQVDTLYSHDHGLRKLADLCGIDARDLPVSPASLFDYTDSDQ